MKYYLHIYVNGHLEMQSIHNTKNEATKHYIEMRSSYPSATLGSKPSGVVTWEIIELKENRGEKQDFEDSLLHDQDPRERI